MKQISVLAGLVSLALISGCSDSTDPDGDVGGSGPIGSVGGDDRRLRQFDNSEAFYSALRDGLVNQASGFASGNDALALESQTAPTVGAGDAGAADAGSSDGGSGGSFAEADTAANSTDGSGRDSVTTTNVQEIGVDEADRVKSDGEYLYVLNSQYDDVYITTDAIEPGNAATTAVEPAAQTISVANSSIAVDSGGIAPQPNISTTVRILSMQNEAPDATAVTDLKVDLGNTYATGMYLYKSADKSNLILTSSGFNNYWSQWNDSFAFSGAQSIVAKLDVSTPEQTAVEKTFAIDGQIISSRRIDNRLFIASRFYPAIQGADPYGMTEEQYRDVVNNADLSELLPKYRSLDDNQEKDLIDPAGCFVAAKPESDVYYSPDIVTLSVIDLNTMELADSECFLGATETLYATTNAVYLATTRWDYSALPQIDRDDAVATTAFVDPRVDTDIHQFLINGAELEYSGSGVVSGHLGWNPLRKPFRMSERNGYLRVATFANQQNESVSPINVTVLSVNGSGALTTVAELPNDNRPAHIGKPGEQLYASRFLGDRAYLVTFRQTDPLYVVDFSNHEDPKLAGELEIEGYSDYLQPIGQDYLLGIGKDAAPAPDGWGDGFGALAQGVKLSLFDVSDPSNPTEVQSMVIGERGTEAIALQNHRAITIQRGGDNEPTRVAFGIDVAGLADPRPISDATLWYPWNFSGLHGFEVNTGAAAGIVKQGVMVVNSASNPTGFGYGYYGDDRSVFVGDSVYYIHGRSVYAANWNDLSNYTGPR